MSYIAFDLDAFDAAESAARHAGASADAVMAGLLRLWRFCWRQKTDMVSAAQLRGVFGIDAGTALEAFGFVELARDGYRVKGADRYLRVQEGRSKGGRAASGNLKRGTKRAGEVAPADSRLVPGLVPADPPADSRAFTDERTANSEQRTANSLRDKPARKTKPPVDPRYGPLVGRLKATYLGATGRPYDFSDGDGAALKALLKLAADDEIDRRWYAGLSADRFGSKCATVLQLRQRWNELGLERRASVQGELHVGAHEPPPKPCALCGSPAATAFGGIAVCYGCLPMAEDEARRVAPDTPWTANLTQWAKQHNQGAAA